MSDDFTVAAVPRTGLGAVCRQLLESVPQWFGIPESNDEYVEFVEGHETWLATTPDGTPIGLVSGHVHFDVTAEIEVLAVRPEWHRRGVGRALIDTFERHHRARGARMLEVKTLGPSHDDEGYRSTRAFYTGVGFVPIEELWIWGPDNPALLLCRPIT